jgi:protein tyrosine phosphatase (PTP) superfamily phosphohydrolase (DUF442 family)
MRFSQTIESIEQIRAYLRLNERVATSGMPRPEHFAAIRRAGFEVVVNLALSTSDNAMANEGEFVTAQGMAYVHIPVNFERPAREDFQKFERVMDAFGARKIFVHCAANMRVSAFMYLYRVRKDPSCAVAALKDMQRIWEPDGAWREFIDALAPTR